MTKASELVALDPDELVTRLAESRRELLNLRFQLATGQLDNTARLRLVRRDVARMLGIVRQREFEELEAIEEEAAAAAEAAGASGEPEPEEEEA